MPCANSSFSTAEKRSCFDPGPGGLKSCDTASSVLIQLTIPGLLKLQPEPFVLVHPRDAEARGISKGERVWVESPRGKVPFTVKVTNAIQPGTVEVNMGGGNPIQAEAWRNANANYLTDPDNRDPISGFPVFKALLCDVKKMTTAT